MESKKFDLPICCNSCAYQWFLRETGENSTDRILNCAMAISLHGMGNMSPRLPEKIDKQIQEYAGRVRSRVRGKQPQAFLAHLHDVFFWEEDFAGNTEDYYNVANNFVPYVMRTKRGLPVVLTIIYREVARRIGLKVFGIGPPGHFLAGVEIGGKIIYIDVFARGRELSVEEIRDKVKQTFGNETGWSNEFLKPVSAKLWLTRVLQNLLNAYGSNGDYTNVAAMLELEMILWPDKINLLRELALALVRCGLTQLAAHWLAVYINRNPNDPHIPDLKQLLEVLSHSR